MARSSYLRDSIGRSYADRLLQKPRRPHNRLDLKRNQLVHSLHVPVETPTWRPATESPFRFVLSQPFRERFVPAEGLARTPMQAQLATTVPASRFANDSNLL